MKHIELSVLNHIMLMNPHHITNASLCEREEVAAPHKICNIEANWEPFLRTEQTREPWVYSKTLSSGCFIVAPMSSTDLWDASSYSDVNWLKHNWGKRFIVTYPTYSDDNGGLFTYSYVGSYIVKLIAPECYQTPNQFLERKSFTICNGFTLAIALHRSGKLPVRKLLDMLERACEGQEADNRFFMHFDEEWMEFYTGHILQVLDFPVHYALCGGCNDAVIRSMWRLMNDTTSGDVYVQCIGGGRSKYLSYMSSAFNAPESLTVKMFRVLQNLENWPMRSSLHTVGDTSEPDWMGFAKLVTCRRGFWREWKKNTSFRRLIMGRLRMCSNSFANTQKGLFNMLFPPLFKLHSEMQEKTARVRSLWRDVIAFYDPEKKQMRAWLRAYLMRIRVTSAMSKAFPDDVIRHPMPPIAFLKDVLGHSCSANMHDVSEYKFWVNSINETRASYIKACGMPLVDVGNGGYAVRSSTYQTLKALAPNAQIAAIYLRYYVEKPVVDRLLCIRHAFREKNGLHVIESLLLDHFRRHRKELYE